MISLIIDIGNTRTKVALFNRGELMISFPTDSFKPHDIQLLKADHPKLNCAIVSSVKNNTSELIEALKQELYYVIELDHTTILPIENLYQTPETLGKDRIAAAVGANKLYPDRNILIIDAGTAITYDFVNAHNQYLGGFITPGLSMRFKALHQFTDKLPLLKAGIPQNFFGRNTNESIIGGIQYGLEGELERIIQLFSTSEKDLLIILTGGDTNYFEKLLKNYKFVALEIILSGLNTILESNYLRYLTNQTMNVGI